MKKSLIAALIASAAWVSVANAETVVYDKDGTSMYIDGRVMVVWYNASNSASNAGAEDGRDSTIINSSRFGIGVRSPIGSSGFTAFAYTQWNFADADLKGNTIEARDQYVGIDGGKWGSIKIGRFQDSLVAVAGDATDIYETWGQTATALGSVERHSGQIQYSWSGYGLTVLAGYQAAKDQVDHPALSKAENLTGNSNYQNRLFYTDDDGEYKCDYANLESGFNIAVTYTTPSVLFGPITVGAGYGWYAVQTDNYGAASGHNNNYYADDIVEWAASVRWGDLSTGPYIAVMYNAVTLGADHADEYWDDTTYQGVEIALGYSFEPGIHIYTGWQWQQIDTDASKLSAYDGESASVIPLFVGWQVNPKFDVWIEAIFAVDTDEKTESWATAMVDENAVGIGARYNF